MRVFQWLFHLTCGSGSHISGGLGSRISRSLGSAVARSLNSPSTDPQLPFQPFIENNATRFLSKLLVRHTHSWAQLFLRNLPHSACRKTRSERLVVSKERKFSHRERERTPRHWENIRFCCKEWKSMTSWFQCFCNSDFHERSGGYKVSSYNYVF